MDIYITVIIAYCSVRILQLSVVYYSLAYMWALSTRIAFLLRRQFDHIVDSEDCDSSLSGEFD